MNTKLALLMCAAASIGALNTFPYAAAQKGWLTGTWFLVGRRGGPVLWVSLGSAALVLGALLSDAAAGRISWWWIPAALVLNFIGGAVLVALVRRASGMVFLVAAPALSLVAYLIA